MMRKRRGLGSAGVVLSLSMALGGCSPNVPPSVPSVPASGAPASVVAVGSPAASAFAESLTPSVAASPAPAIPRASATLEPISLSRLGSSDWILISSDTREQTQILGNVRHDYGYVFTCIGEGNARVSITATTSKMVENPDATPIAGAGWMGRCPTTAIVTDLTGMFDGGSYSLSPSADVPDGVTYLLLVGTLPN
jgi:hypothetical protein